MNDNPQALVNDTKPRSLMNSINELTNAIYETEENATRATGTRVHLQNPGSTGEELPNNEKIQEPKDLIEIIDNLTGRCNLANEIISKNLETIHSFIGTNEIS